MLLRPLQYLYKDHCSYLQFIDNAVYTLRQTNFWEEMSVYSPKIGLFVKEKLRDRVSVSFRGMWQRTRFLHL